MRPMRVGPACCRISFLLVLAAGSAPEAWAGGASPTDLSVPMFAAAPGDPYSLTVAPSQTGPAGTVAVTQPITPPAYSFEEFKQNVHGYVSTGVSSRGGYGVDGGLLLPIVPGKAELEISGGTGQTGDLFPKVPGWKHLHASTTGYSAALHIQPADNIDIIVGYTSNNLKFSQPPLQ